MGNRRFYKIRCFHTLGMVESERQKVTALNLFHPTASPPFQKIGFFILRHSLRGRGMGEGTDFDYTDLIFMLCTQRFQAFLEIPDIRLDKNI
jgi:hypothetical protein